MSLQQEMTPKEMGLIKHLSFRNYQLRDKTEMLNESIILACKMLWDIGGEEQVKIYRCGLGGWEKAFQLTNISEYTNKKGMVHHAHFTQQGKYVGTTNKLGNIPIYTLQYVFISEDSFHLWKIHPGNPERLMPRDIRPSD